MRVAASWRRWSQLTASERRFLVRAAFATTFFTVSVRICALKRVMRWARAGLTPAVRDAAAPERLAALARAAARVSPVRSTCLSRALALQWLLAREGVHADLRIGARVSEGHLDAHAWLEWNGEPLGDRRAALRGFHVLTAH